MKSKFICTLVKVEVMKLLISHGSNVSATNNNGNTPLHWAAQEGSDVWGKLFIYIFFTV